MNDPHLATVWTARACAVLWLVSLATALQSGRKGAFSRRWKVLWSVAGILLGVHILVAFHFEHAWSHVAAYRHTARQTAATVGLNWGGGIYFNYAALGIWLADVILIWRRRGALLGSQRWRVFVDWFIAFMMINATVVFGAWGWKPLGFAMAVGLSLAFQKRRRDVNGEN